MKKQILLFTLFSFISIFAFAQANNLPRIDILTQGTNTSLRGLSVVNDAIAWVSGSNGTVGRTSDGGKTWKWIIVKGFEKSDFRDIEAFDATTAIIMAIDAPAYILKTVDGGESWKVVYENKTKGMFLDAMEFWNVNAGIVVGDPINGRLFVARTFDGGNSWKEIPDNYKPRVDTGEAMFAASGTNVRILDRDEAVIITGGTSSRIFIRDSAFRLPLIQGKETTGANSIDVLDKFSRKGGQVMIVVGGDFNQPASDSLNCFYSNDRGKTWRAPRKPPHGYRSSVEYLSRRHVITCGITGVDYSIDAGKTWTLISNEGFHVTRIAKMGAMVLLAGRDGKIGKVIYPSKK